MPTSRSSKKRVRQNARRNALNNWRKRRIKAQIKTFLEALREQKLDEAETEYRKTCGLLDKIACTSSIHRNTAARRKSRLARRLKELRQTATA